MCKELIWVRGRIKHGEKRRCKKTPIEPISVHLGYCSYHSKARNTWIAERSVKWAQLKDNDRWVGRFLRLHPGLQGTYNEILEELKTIKKACEIHDLKGFSDEHKSA